MSISTYLLYIYIISAKVPSSPTCSSPERGGDPADSCSLYEGGGGCLDIYAISTLSTPSTISRISTLSTLST